MLSRFARYQGKAVRRSLSVVVASSVAALSLSAGSVAGAASATARPAPYVAVKHLRLLNAMVQKSATVSFVLKGLPTTGVKAVVLSVSVTSPTATGSLVGYPYGAKRPHVVSLSFSRGKTVSGLVVVEGGRKGRAALFNASSAGEHLTATVVGYYAAPGVTNAATAFMPVTPKRLASVLLKAKASGAFVAVGRAGVATTDTAGVVVAVTTATPAGKGALRLFPYGSKSSTSLAFVAGRTKTTLVVLTPGSKGRVKLANTSTGSVRVLVDVVGYLTTLHVPGAPTAVTATAGSSAALVGWKAPATDGGAPVSSYTVTSSPGGLTATASGAATSVLVRGLTAGTSYTFTVTAANSRGSGPASAATSSVSPYTTPDAPGGAFGFTGGYGQIVVVVASSGSDGGSPVTSYAVTASPGGAVVTVAATAVPTSGALTLADLPTATFNGLTPGTSYTFTVVAINAAGGSAASPAISAIQAGGISRASVSGTGAQADNGSLDSDLSADGRYVVFDSAADNLAAGDTGGHEDVFVRDRLLGTTALVSAANGGGFADDDSFQPSISADGRYVAFSSKATNLTGAVIGGHFEVYVRDLQQGKTKLISASGAVAADADSSSPAISADGNTIAFVSAADNLWPINTGLHQQVYAADRQSDDLIPVSVGVGNVQANGDSSQPTISGDGTIVAWTSKAHNLETVLATTHQNIYQRTLSSAATSLLSSDDLVIEGNADSQDPRISQDGSYTAFDSLASNLTVMPDTNGVADVFLCFKGCNTPEAVDLGPFGNTSNRGASLPSLSKDGSVVAYASTSTDLAAGVVPSASAPQIFVSAWSSKVTQVATRAADGSLGNVGSTLPRLTGDGAHVSFATFASNLAATDTNSKLDVEVADLPSTLAGGLPSF